MLEHVFCLIVCLLIIGRGAFYLQIDEASDRYSFMAKMLDASLISIESDGSRHFVGIKLSDVSTCSPPLHEGVLFFLKNSMYSHVS
jgi:hypothetical protein